MRYWREITEAAGGLLLIGAGVFVHPVLGLATAGLLLVLVANFAGGNRGNPAR